LVDASTRRAFRAMAALFWLGTAAIAGAFVYEIFHRHQIRTGLVLIALFTGVAAYGLWTLRSWARGLGLFVALAMSGLGAVALFAAIASHRGKVVPGVLLVASMAVGYVLGMSVFSLPDR
jgi:hypothetical protein